MGKFGQLMAVGSFFVATACASVPMAAPTEDARGKNFEPPAAEQAALYFYRSNYPGVTAFTITIGQLTVGQLASGTYMRTEVAAGRHDVRCVGSENTAGLTIEAQRGSIHYVRVTTRPGILCGLVETQDVEGRQAVNDARRAAEVR
jgi:hypothetical protein